MQAFRIACWIPVLLLLSAGTCIALAAAAGEGTLTIAYRGSGGSYIGDTIVFDGLNTLGNTTAIKITGPGLPVEGVPLYDLDGVPGAGNIAKVDSRNLWVFSWDMSRVDTAKLQTARYTFTAWDPGTGGGTATTSLVLKQPEFYLVAKPLSGRIGDYIELEGMAEKGISYLRLDMRAPDGAVVHTFITPVSGLGFFQHGFRIDMAPGRYSVVGSNPSMKKDLTVFVTVVPPEIPAVQPDSAATGPASPAGTPAAGAATTVPSTPAPSRAGNLPSALALSLAGAGIALFLYGRT